MTSTHYVIGDTYPHRNELRQRGLQWDPTRRGWHGTLEQVSGLGEVQGLTVLPVGMVDEHQDEINLTTTQPPRRIRSTSRHERSMRRHLGDLWGE